MADPAGSVLALANAATAVRLSLHVLGAAVWVGGQITVAGLLPTLRSLGEDVPRRVARAFARIEWPAFALLVATGIWNVVAARPTPPDNAWSAVLVAKVVVVALAGLGAFLHQRSRSRRAIAGFGALAGMATLIALVLGVVLAG